MVTQWAGHHVHPRNAGRTGQRQPLLGGYFRAQPAQGADRGRGQRSVMVAAAGLGHRGPAHSQDAVAMIDLTTATTPEKNEAPNDLSEQDPFAVRGARAGGLLEP